MTAGILCIGTEITRGEIVNTNATWLADRVTQAGLEVTEIACVDDDRARIVDMLRRMASEHEVIVSTGGLGPTSDDLTSACAAMAAGLPLVRDVASVEAIRDRFRVMRFTMAPSNVKQADMPSGAVVMPNAVGTAPGFWMRMGRAKVFFFPGVPREMHYLWETHAEPVVRSMAREPAVQLRLNTFGEGESAVAERLSDIEARYPGITVGYRATFPAIEVKLLAKGRGARELVEAAAVDVRTRLGKLVYAEGQRTFVSVVADAVRARGYRLALAESCTGGLVAQMLTSESASDYLVAGMVTYANEAKTKLLGVPEAMLEEHGAVSEPVARAMAEGAARAMGVELGLGITGVAGPTGGSPDKPVGLVHYAVAYPGGVEVRHRVFPGERARVQRFAAFAALQLLRTCLA